ncbi:MAG: stalk domain-containing protein [Caldiserica bacterium]|nr:stalk domain-containing protein [Caldisericota bacterium]
MNRRRVLCVAILLLAVLILDPACTAISAVAARASETTSGGGFVVLKTFSAAVTVVGALDGTLPVLIVATQDGAMYGMSGASTVFQKLPTRAGLMKVTSITVLAADRWLVGTDGDGLWLSKGAGTSFERVTTLNCSRVASVLQDSRDPNRLFLASPCSGLHYSNDRGATWKSDYAGITSLALTDVIRMDGDCIAVSSQDAGVYVSADNGTSYAKTACPIKGVSSLAWSGPTRTLFAAGDTAVAMTTDEGSHWTVLPSPGSVASLVSLPSGTLLAGIADRGVLRWDGAAKAWRDVAQGAGITSVSTMYSTGVSLLIGGSTGTVVRADLSVPIAAVSPSTLDLESIPANQARSTTFSVTNLGAGTLDWHMENVPGYIQVMPQSGTGNVTATVRIEGDSLGKGPHQSLLKIVTSGGSQTLALRFSVADAAPVRMTLIVGNVAATVGQEVFTLDAAVFIDKASGRTMVPMRFIGEAFGAIVTWDAPTRRVFVETQATVNHKPLRMIMTVGSKKATANGKMVTLDATPVIVSGRTFVPLRVISETLGADVSWNALTRAVGISYMP